MNKEPKHLPHSIAEYGHDHQIWTDIDLAKWAGIAFVIGFVLGYSL